MKLIVITPDETMPGETVIVNQLFENGLQRLHLRKSGFYSTDYRTYIKSIAPEYHSRIVVHDFFGLYDEFGLGGIHLNSATRMDKGTSAKIEQFSPSVISTSFHSWKEIEENEFPFGYVFISPVFDSISKMGYTASIALNRAEPTRHKLMKRGQYCPPFYALGGVRASHIEILKDYNFDGVAMLGAIWHSESPVTTFCEAMDQIKAIGGD